MSPHHRLLDATGHLATPFAVVDAHAMDFNAADMVRRASGKPIRVATKSLRVRGLAEWALARDGFAGLMTYSLDESLWLADHGFDDILVAYPSVSAEGFRALIDSQSRLEAITVMVDSTESLDFIDSVLGSGHPDISICLDIDASLRLGPAHLGVRRSPVHSVKDARRVAANLVARKGFRLDGLMFYDAQIAGLRDSSKAIRMVKVRSDAELYERRANIVEAVGQMTTLRLVNGGGTGSIDRVAGDASLTEVAAGSGFFAPHLFDDYDTLELQPAAYFALSVVRKPTKNIATCFAGGYAASGPGGTDRSPIPVHPEGLSLLKNEGAGEVQTPLKGASELTIGDRVLFRHAKAGEMCERFNQIALVAADGTAEIMPTYRGEGKNFG